MDQHSSPRIVLARALAIACTVPVAVVLSEPEDWRPWTLVVALGLVMIAADAVAIQTRRIRVSAGLMVQSTAMALLGPTPAWLMGIAATGTESGINRIRIPVALTNIVIFALLGLIGGVLFDRLGDAFGVDDRDAAYALLVMPIYAVLIAVNLALVIAFHPELAREERRSVFRESALPGLPVEVVSGSIATAAVLVGTYAPLAAPAGLLVVLLITIPLERMLGNALVSDERAAEVASLASDRDRLFVEMLDAEDRERARLAESLHDGPMQRLMAMRQDVGGGTSGDELAAHLDRTIAETRAIISAFHPASVSELGFAATLRAAVEPFPAAAAVELNISTTVDDQALAQSLAMPVARELVVNAVKHADPTRIDVTVDQDKGRLVVEINDDGIGIDGAHADRAVQAGHLGLAMVRRRVEDAGGELEIATRTDGGTRSRVVLPTPSEV